MDYILLAIFFSMSANFQIPVETEKVCKEGIITLKQESLINFPNKKEGFMTQSNQDKFYCLRVRNTPKPLNESKD